MDPAVTERLGAAHPLARHLSDFLTDLGNANASAHTIGAYRGDLLQFAAHHDGEIGEISAGPVRAYRGGTCAASSLKHGDILRGGMRCARPPRRSRPP